MVQKGAVKLKYIAINEHIAYVLTKPPSNIKFEYLRDKLGVVQNELPTREEVLSYICDSMGSSI
jgi:hypothetical protein